MRARGFTLLEVLIALAIVALSVGALLGTLTSSASNVSYLQEKTLAEWVALNRLTEVRIDQNLPDPGKRTGNTVLGGMRWEWEEEVAELPTVKGLLRIDVRARPTGELVDDSKSAPSGTGSSGSSGTGTPQKLSESKPAGSDMDKLDWLTTVTGIVSTSRSPRRDAIATPYIVTTTQGPTGQPPGGPKPSAPAPGSGN